MKIKIIFPLLIFAALLFFSCGNSNGEDKPKPDGGTDAPQDFANETEQPAALITDDLTGADYGNRTFTFVTSGEVHWGLC